MKVSEYNIYFDIKCIIYNTLYRNIVFVSSSVYNLLKNKKGKLSTQELTIISEKCLKKLLNNRIIIDDKLIENPYECNKYFNYYINEKILYVKLLTTLNCNLTCSYCYENNKSFNRSKKAKQHNTNLTKQNATAIILFIEKYAKENKITKFHISWYGGEPLLNIRIIKYISKKLISFCKSKKIKYYSDISTNGTLLYKRKVISTLKKACVSLIGITIDGDKENHNKMRTSITKDKNALYNSIINNIDKLSVTFNFMIRIMLNKNTQNKLDNILEDFNYIRNKKNLTFFVGGLENIEGCLSKKKYLQELTLSYLEITKIRSTFFYLCSKYNLQGVPETGPLPNSICYALNPSTFIIAPDLYIYKCPDEIGINKYQYGKIKINGIFEKFKNNNYSNFRILNSCTSCRMLPTCNGGCIFRRLQTNKLECVFKTTDGIEVSNKKILQDSILSYVYAQQKGLVPFQENNKRFYNEEQ